AMVDLVLHCDCDRHPFHLGVVHHPRTDVKALRVRKDPSAPDVFEVGQGEPCLLLQFVSASPEPIVQLVEPLLGLLQSEGHVLASLPATEELICLRLLSVYQLTQRHLDMAADGLNLSNPFLPNLGLEVLEPLLE